MSEWIVGINAVHSVLSARPESVRELWVGAERDDARTREVLKLAGDAGIAIQRPKARAFEQRFAGQNHQQVAVQAAPRALGDQAELMHHIASVAEPRLLLLDQLQDPRNFGACLRSAEAAGVDGVVFTRDRAAPLSAVARQAAAGAAERLPLFEVANLANTMRALKDAGVWLYGAAGDAGEPMWQMDLRGPVGLVMGSEGKGLRRLTRELCDGLIAIPMAPATESLNVSVACGVLLYEIARQRVTGT